MTGSMPGMAASTRRHAYWVAAEFGGGTENSLALDVTWACTSRPITTSQSPVSPEMRLLVVAAMVFDVSAIHEAAGAGVEACISSVSDNRAVAEGQSVVGVRAQRWLRLLRFGAVPRAYRQPLFEPARPMAAAKHAFRHVDQVGETRLAQLR